MLETLPKRTSRHFYNQTRLHEVNYCMLSQLLPNIHAMCGEITRQVSESNKLTISIKEHCRYTTVLALTLELHTKPSLICDMVFEVRIYHDVCVAEATHYQGHGKFEAKYPQQHHLRYHEDEKHQANRLLQECLKYCLKHLPHN